VNAFEKDWIAVVINVNADQVKIQEIKEEILNLLLLDCDSDQVRQS